MNLFILLFITITYYTYFIYINKLNNSTTYVYILKYSASEWIRLDSWHFINVLIIISQWSDDHLANSHLWKMQLWNVTINGIKVAVRPPILYLEGWTITVANYRDSSTTTIVMQWLCLLFPVCHKCQTNIVELRMSRKTVPNLTLYVDHCTCMTFQWVNPKLEIAVMNNAAVSSEWVTLSW